MAVLGRDPITGAFGCQVLELDEEFAWSQVHQTLFTNSSLLNEHASVSLSGNGQVLAIGIPSYQADGMEAPANAGQTIIFREVMDQWIQWDSPITGEDLNGFSGRDIQLNGTGNRIAIGAPGEYDLQDFPGKFAVWQNGTFVKIDEKPIANDLFYPNPSSGVVRSKQTYKGKIDIWNSMGQLVASMNMPSSELDLSFLETGIYVLKCDECKQSQHLVIQR